MKTPITPEDCVRFAEEWEDPMESSLRVILRRGTFCDLRLWDVEDDSRLSALMERAFETGTVPRADRDLLLEHLAPLLREEWEKGRFDVFWSEEDPGYHLLVQCFPGENIDALGMFCSCWFGGAEDCGTVMAYREADSFDPEIAEILVGMPDGK